MVVNRSDISVRTPDGRRLPLVTQDEFRSSFGQIRIPVERSLAVLPILDRYRPNQMPCDRWFFVGPFGGFAFDEIPVNTFLVCSGPLAFKVPGGVQPGAWPEWMRRFKDY